MQHFVDWFKTRDSLHILMRGMIMKRYLKDILGYFLLFFAFIAIPLMGNHAVHTLSQKQEVHNTIIIDAGHGGIDGGAVSVSGAYESHINLEISQKLNDLMHLLGIQTIMIRNEDISVYTDGETIAAKKVSDIHERVRVVNTTPNALLISIHQNTFSDPKYNGLQVFYNSISDSKLLAEHLQAAIRKNIDSGNKRQCKKASGIYLMDHINCHGILIECGFLSNPEEELKLRNPEYQKKLCAIIAATVSQYLNT